MKIRKDEWRLIANERLGSLMASTSAPGKGLKYRHKKDGLTPKATHLFISDEVEDAVLNIPDDIIVSRHFDFRRGQGWLYKYLMQEEKYYQRHAGQHCGLFVCKNNERVRWIREDNQFWNDETMRKQKRGGIYGWTEVGLSVSKPEATRIYFS